MNEERLSQLALRHRIRMTEDEPSQSDAKNVLRDLLDGWKENSIIYQEHEPMHAKRLVSRPDNILGDLSELVGFVEEVKVGAIIGIAVDALREQWSSAQRHLDFLGYDTVSDEYLRPARMMWEKADKLLEAIGDIDLVPEALTEFQVELGSFISERERP